METRSERRVLRSGGAFEALAGYSRAVRIGPTIAVSGTAAIGPDGRVLHAGDTHAQTREAFERALAAVEELGGTRERVLRTRIFLTPDADWRGAAEAHRELFEGIDPANTTLFVAGFIPEGVLVEVEVDAVL
jgi:enamine deaminase RidA (YjgF/YER057c/UK114 family)